MVHYPELLSIAALAAAAALLLWAAACDVRSFRIPNVASLGLVALFAFNAWLLGLNWVGHAAAGLVALGVGAALFFARLAGGGDVKLLAALALWAGPSQIAGLLGATALAGGALAVIVLVTGTRGTAPKLAPSGAPASNAMKARIPYGVAIAAGGFWVFAAQSASLFK